MTNPGLKTMNPRLNWLRLLAWVGCLAAAVPGTAAEVPGAELRMPAIFGDHMVLQAEADAAVWGWAEPGQEVSVSLGTETTTATADDAGKWTARLATPGASEDRALELTVTAADETLTFTDVLIGEVWLCSGQSNMDMRMYKMPPEHEAAAEHPKLRLFRVERALHDTPQDDLEGQWEVCTPKNVRDFSAAAYYFGKQMRGDLGVPVGLIHTAYGGTAVEGWTSRDMLDTVPEAAPILDRHDRGMEKYEKELAAYEQKKAEGATGDELGEPPTGPTERYRPGHLFNAMVHPLVPYTVRGVLWYQGESNQWRGEQYRYLLTGLINDWRARWDRPDLPFAVVQLPNYAQPPRVPRGAGSFAEIRESQMVAVRGASEAGPAGLIVTIDIGNPTDIHPQNKWDVGDRLARWALAEVYGRDVVPGGPMFTGHEIVGDKVYLNFDSVGSGLATRDGGPLRGFIIAGPDQKFRWAVAEVEGDRIVVSEAKVPSPQAVRYAWEEDPWWANLVNAEGLPASPFRTDNWEGITAGAR